MRGLAWCDLSEEYPSTSVFGTWWETCKLPVYLDVKLNGMKPKEGIPWRGAGSAEAFAQQLAAMPMVEDLAVGDSFAIGDIYNLDNSSKRYPAICRECSPCEVTANFGKLADAQGPAQPCDD